VSLQQFPKATLKVGMCEGETITQKSGWENSCAVEEQAVGTVAA